MMVYLDRFKSNNQGTFGGLVTEDGKQLCFTVERPLTGDHPCIPNGVYLMEKFQSPSKGDVWLMKNPPAGRTMIEMHVAQTYKEILGCIGVGDRLGTLNGLPAVMNSKATFAMLKATLPDSFTLTITGDL